MIQPSSDPQVFDTSNDVVSALKQDQVDAVVVDTPTALYLTAVQVPDGTIVGEFPAPGGDEWGALLAKDSPLTDCVSAAVDELRRARASWTRSRSSGSTAPAASRSCSSGIVKT